MARSGKTAQEFIQSSFSPIIAVLCSPKVGTAVAKNNLSFVELLQPFTGLDWEGQFREPNGTVCSIKNLKLVIRDVNWKPLQPTEARRQLNNAVLNNYNDKTTSLEIDGRKLNVPQATPWFEAWRETYLEVQFPSDHEFTKHYLSCLFVNTTSDENVIETYHGLNQEFAQLQNVTPPKLPKWFNNNILKSYILLHDTSCVSYEKAESMFENMKQHFEASNCFMLTINSRSTTDPLLTVDVWSPYVRMNNDVIHETIPASTATTPLDPQTGISSVNIPADQEEGTYGTALTQPEPSHPLTTIENDLYDNANSLQTHSFSGSAESVYMAGKALDSSTEVHGAALNASDIDGIKKFIQEYASRALLPYIEKQIAILSEAVANKKGVSRSLLSATKRWFGTGKGAGNTANNIVIYSTECPELQLRRLGDLWFMCGQWQRAFDTYHTAKREFYADGAWLCYAGALEMAALSAFMAGESSRKTHAYMEESIVTYLNTCRMVQYAVRATLLSAVCLSSSGLHGEAAKQLIRMTSEDSDLRSAMLLEQAALCFLSGPGTKAMRRKYAFHMVLAGHRFSKAGQKKHAYRCYKQAYEVYEDSGWRLSTDHVQVALGRLAGAQRRAGEAARWLRGPLAAHSPQPRSSHLAFLRDYMQHHQQWVESSEPQRELPALPLPLLERGHTAVLCAGPAPLSAPGRVPAGVPAALTAHTAHTADHKYWSKMEEMVLQVARGAVPMIFKPTVNLYTVTTECTPSVPQGEPTQISITLKNPLKIPIALKELELLWRFLPKANDVAETTPEWISNEASLALGTAMENNVIYGQKIKSVVLEGEGTEMLTFSVTSLQVGNLVIHGLAYKLVCGTEDNAESSNSISISGKLSLDAVDVRKPNGIANGSYKCLQIAVVPYAPCLQMTFSETSSEAISGEIRSIDIELRNVGPVEMKNLHFAVSHPDCLQIVNSEDGPETFKILYEEKYRQPTVQTGAEERAARAKAWRAACARHVVSAGAGAAVAAGGGLGARLLLRPARALYLLAYYEGADGGYRLLRHVFRFQVSEAVDISATPRRSIAKVDNQAAEKMSLAVEVKNICDEKNLNVTVEVLEASLLSRQWKFTDYVAAARDRNDALSSREKTHLVLEAIRISDTLPEDKVEWSSLKLAKHSPESEPNINVPPYSKFVFEYENSFVDDEEFFLKENKNISNGLIQSMFIVRWKVHNNATKKTAVGQHCLWLECFTKISSKVREHVGLDVSALDELDSKTDLLYDNKNKKDNIVLFNMEHSGQIQHNFKQRRLCVVPITINIVNCYQMPVKAFIDMSKKREHSGELGWTGALSSGDGIESSELGVSVSLDKLESRKVQVGCVCAAPGTYAVGGAFTVTSRARHRPVLSSCANAASLLVVRQSV